MSAPARPEGTRPNAVSAEKRPPTLGSALKTLRYPASRAESSLGDRIGHDHDALRCVDPAFSSGDERTPCRIRATVEPDLDRDHRGGLVQVLQRKLHHFQVGGVQHEQIRTLGAGDDLGCQG